MSKKTLFGIIGGILLFAVFLFIAIGSSWFTNGDFKTWHNNWFQGTETPEEDSAATAGIHTHNHALSVSSDEDENAGIELYSSDITTYIGERAECPLCGSWAYFFKLSNSASPCEFNGQYRCDNSEDCGWNSSRIIGTFHDYSWVISTAPTKDTPGVASETCSRCGDVHDTCAVYALPDDPVKEGYHFVGWYLDEEFTQAYDNSPIYEDTQLYAKFEINVYTVTFDSAGGSAVDSKQVNWNESVTLPDSEREGYNFLGWYLSDGTKYEGQTIKENTTLTAHWEIKRFTVLFYVEGELYTTVTVDYGTSLGAVADVAEVFLNNIVSFANVNGETPKVTADKMTVSDDMIVVANKPSTFEKIWKYKYTPYIIGGVCAIVALGVAVTVIEKKKKQV